MAPVPKIHLDDVLGGGEREAICWGAQFNTAVITSQIKGKKKEVVRSESLQVDKEKTDAAHEGCYVYNLTKIAF